MKRTRVKRWWEESGGWVGRVARSDGQRLLVLEHRKRKRERERERTGMRHKRKADATSYSKK